MNVMLQRLGERLCAWRGSLAAAAMVALTALGSASNAATVTYFHNDISGSPVMATDATGAPLWKENYRPYGSKWNNAPGSNANAIGFTGQPFDASTGLSYMGARYYDPTLGRFMAVDPVGVDLKNLHSFNRYAYANNNPYKFVDPDGRSPALVVEGVGVLVLGGIFYAAQPAHKQREMREAFGGALRKLDRMFNSDASQEEPNTASGADSGKQPSASDRGSRRPSKGTKEAADQDATDENGRLRCQYCGTELTKEPGQGNSREYDHYHPWSKGGGSGPDNIVDGCRDCNRGKGSKLFPDEWVPPPKP